MALQSDNAEPHIEQKILGGYSISKPPVLAQGVASAETIRIFI